MKQVMACCVVVGIVLVGGAFCGCSDKKEPGSAKGVVKQMTEETAKEAAQQIRTPIDKAREAAGREKQRVGRRREEAVTAAAGKIG
jgi:hypothetical protein